MLQRFAILLSSLYLVLSVRFGEPDGDGDDTHRNPTDIQELRWQIHKNRYTVPTDLDGDIVDGDTHPNSTGAHENTVPLPTGGDANTVASPEGVPGAPDFDGAAEGAKSWPPVNKNLQPSPKLRKQMEELMSVVQNLDEAERDAEPEKHTTSGQQHTRVTGLQCNNATDCETGGIGEGAMCNKDKQCECMDGFVFKHDRCDLPVLHHGGGAAGASAGAGGAGAGGGGGFFSSVRQAFSSAYSYMFGQSNSTSNKSKVDPLNDPSLVSLLLAASDDVYDFTNAVEDTFDFVNEHDDQAEKVSLQGRLQLLEQQTESDLMDGKHVQWGLWQIVGDYPSALRHLKGKMILAFRGTDSMKGVLQDISLGVNGRYAHMVVDKCVAIVKQLEAKGRKIDYVTGHSLGGFLAESTASRLGLTGAVFNSPGPCAPFYTFCGDNFPKHFDVYLSSRDIVSLLPPGFADVSHMAAPIWTKFRDIPEGKRFDVSRWNTIWLHGTITYYLEDVLRKSGKGKGGAWI